jgi:hypothetical protein
MRPKRAKVVLCFDINNDLSALVPYRRLERSSGVYALALRLCVRDQRLATLRCLLHTRICDRLGTISKGDIPTQNHLFCLCTGVDAHGMHGAEQGSASRKRRDTDERRRQMESVMRSVGPLEEAIDPSATDDVEF